MLHRYTGAAADCAPPPPQDPTAYEVRVRRTLGDAVCVIGHDRHGAPLIEIRAAHRHLTPAFVEGVERWCRENDAPLFLVTDAQAADTH